MILYELHPIFTTIENSMGAPKENKGSETIVVSTEKNSTLLPQSIHISLPPDHPY